MACSNALIPRDLFPQLEAGSIVEAPIYLDSAATNLVPRCVLDSFVKFSSTINANVHRGAHAWSEAATDLYEATREKLGTFLSVPSDSTVIFTHGATEALNMAALCWATSTLRPHDKVVVALDNHHANLVPWLRLQKTLGIEVLWLSVDDRGILDYDSWLRLMEQKPRLVALTQQSNVLGFKQPFLKEIIEDAQREGLFISLDGAQSAGHEQVDLNSLRPDFYGISAHKMLGITGVGALICSERALAAMEPAIVGGGMVERVDRESYRPVLARRFHRHPSMRPDTLYRL